VDTAQVFVTVTGAVAIAVIVWFFFGGQRRSG
jgi:hypothetical protein